MTQFAVVALTCFGEQLERFILVDLELAHDDADCGTDAASGVQGGRQVIYLRLKDLQPAVTGLPWYLQLTFDRPILNCEAWPIVSLGNGEVRHDDPGYRDALYCSPSQTIVSTKERTGIELLIEIERGTMYSPVGRRSRGTGDCHAVRARG